MAKTHQQSDLKSLADVMAEMREFRKLHPAPAPLPPKPKRQKGKR